MRWYYYFSRMHLFSEHLNPLNFLLPNNSFFSSNSNSLAFLIWNIRIGNIIFTMRNFFPDLKKSYSQYNEWLEYTLAYFYFTYIILFSLILLLIAARHLKLSSPEPAKETTFWFCIRQCQKTKSKKNLLRNYSTKTKNLEYT